jgi:2-dehydro-3-deoxy-D-gluconate 5-dehydrogenase
MRMFDLSGRKALVTGANTGIGQAIAVALAEASAHVVCAGRSPMDETIARIRELGGSASECTLDLAQPTAAAARLTQADTEFGGLDILVNNAGIIRRADAVDFTEADWDAVVDVNLKAVFFLPGFRSRRARPRRPRPDHQHRLDAVLPGRYPGRILHGLKERRAWPDQDARL